MKKLYYIFASILLSSVFLVACQQNEDNTTEKEQEETTPTTNESTTDKEVDNETAQDENHKVDEVIAEENEGNEEEEDSEQVEILTAEEINTIASEKFYSITMEPLSTGISLYDYVMPALNDDPSVPDAIELYENGLDPNSKTYEAANEFFQYVLQDHVTDDAYRMAVSHRILLLMNPHNETPFTPAYNHFEVIDVKEDAFVIQHSYAEDGYNTLFESTFVLEDGHWKYDGSKEIGTV